MNANKQDAGGLPELPEPVLDVRTHEFADASPVIRERMPADPYYTADQMRAYGELCRAAPAGGDSLRLLVKELRESLEGVVRVADRQTDEFDRAREAIARAAHVFVNAGDSEAQFIADSRDLNCPACGGSGHVDDSAPAGSGEVDIEEFREAVELLRITSLGGKRDCERHGTFPHDFDRSLAKADRLIALIDSRAALLRKLQQGAE